MSAYRFVLLVLALFTCAACSNGGGVGGSPPQQWGDITVVAESRPSPPRVGMNEFLIIATAAGGKPAWDMVVMLRPEADESWRQAIQDGESGVYRKALPLVAGPQSVHVKLTRNGDETMLEFPVTVQ